MWTNPKKQQQHQTEYHDESTQAVCSELAIQDDEKQEAFTVGY